MTKALQIANWSRYEKADSKKVTTMQWVAVPINHSGLGYLEMVSRPDGVRTIGGWLLILQLAAQCPHRGLLVSDGGRILGAREISLKTRASESDISAAIAVLLELGWLEEVDVSGHCPDGVRTVSGLQDKTRQDREGRQGDESEPSKLIPAVRQTPPPLAPVLARVDQANREREREVRAMLISYGCRTGTDQIEEWRLLISESFAGTSFPPDVKLDAIERALRNGKQMGKPVSYAREAAEFLREWVAKLVLRHAEDKSSLMVPA